MKTLVSELNYIFERHSLGFSVSRRDETEFFLNLIKCEISNVKLQCQLDFIVMNFVEQFKQNWKRGILMESSIMDCFIKRNANKCLFVIIALIRLLR